MIAKHGFLNLDRSFLVILFFHFVNNLERGAACLALNNERSIRLVPKDMTDEILCSEEERGRFMCLNGGECVKPAADSPLSMCRCTSEYEGTHCESKAMPDFESLYSAKVYAPLIAVTILGVFILLMVIVYYAYKKHKRGYEPCKEETNVGNANPHNYS